MRGRLATHAAKGSPPRGRPPRLGVRICACLAALLVLPATATSSIFRESRSFYGPLQGGGTIGFPTEVRVIKKRHQPPTVDVISLFYPGRIRDVPVTCDQFVYFDDL